MRKIIGAHYLSYSFAGGSIVHCAVPATEAAMMLMVVKADTTAAGNAIGAAITATETDATMAAVLRTLRHQGGVGAEILLNNLFMGYASKSDSTKALSFWLISSRFNCLFVSKPTEIT